MTKSFSLLPDGRLRLRATCPVTGCERYCGNAGGVATHIRNAHPDYIAPAPFSKGVETTKTRTSYSNAQKNRGLTRYFELESDPLCATPHKQTCIELWGPLWENRKGYLSKWLDAAGKIRGDVFKGLKGAAAAGRSVGSGRPAAFAAEDDELYVRVLFRRMEHGYPVNHFWLQMEFGSILEESKPNGYRDFKCSPGWAVRFCVRYRLSTQAANNIKAHDQVDRADAIRQFHQYWILVVQQSEPQLHPKFGRFGPRRILHVDQVPLPFAAGHKKTLNPTGFGSCRIAGPNTAGLEKRQATLQLWIVADEFNQYVKPTIIFRGTRGPRSKLPWPAEKTVYDALDNIRVAFQKNAWADEQFCEEDILAVAGDIHRAGIEGEVVAGMDNHSAQRTQGMLDLYKNLGMYPLFTSANCTDCISPVDHHIGRYIQTHMGRSYRQELQDNPAHWFAGSGADEIEDVECSSAMHRRILMARWLSAAWDDLRSKEPHMLRSAFVQTGFLVAKDGSEDDLIKIQGWSSSEPYRYRL